MQFWQSTRRSTRQSSHRAPRGGNCWTENAQPCPASVLPITNAEAGLRPPLAASPTPFNFLPHPLPCHLEAPARPTTFRSCFLLVDPSPSPSGALGQPTPPRSSPASERGVRRASPEDLCRGRSQVCRPSPVYSSRPSSVKCARGQVEGGTTVPGRTAYISK
jgi:hypothetical protein